MRQSVKTGAVSIPVLLALAGACVQPHPAREPQALTAAQAAPAADAAMAAFKAQSPAFIEAYMNQPGVKKLQLGAGRSRLPGWLNTDIEPGERAAFLDATQRFPFDDGTLNYIFSEHVIEHLTYDEGKAMVAEAYRVLAPGGKMRVSTPNMARFIELFDKNPSEEAKAYIDGKRYWHEWPREGNPATIILNLQMSSWGHKFMYDVETLGGILTAAGFRNVKEFEENISSDPHLSNLEERDTGVNARWSDYETMSVEVEKPAVTTERR